MFRFENSCRRQPSIELEHVPKMSYLAAAKKDIWKHATDAIALMEKKSKGKGKGKTDGKWTKDTGTKGPGGKGGKGKDPGGKGSGAGGSSAATDKGKGKGKGPAGKGKGQPAGYKKEWPCEVEECSMCYEGKLNRASRTECMGCGQPRGTLSKCAEDDEGWAPALSNRAAKRSAAQAKKDKDLTAENKALKVELAAAKGTPAVAPAEAAGTVAPEGAGFKLNDAAAALKPAVRTALGINVKRTVKLETVYVAPTAAEAPVKAAQEIVDAGCKAQDETLGLQHKLDVGKKERANMEVDSPLIVGADLRIKELTESLELKLKSIRSSGFTSVEILRTKRQKYREEETARSSQSIKLTTEWQEQYDAMKEAVTRERDLLDQQLEEMRVMEGKVMEQWKAVEDSKIDLAQKVDAAWDVKIAACVARVNEAAANGLASASPHHSLAVGEPAAVTPTPQIIAPTPAVILPQVVVIPDTHLISFVGQEEVPALENVTKEEIGFLNHLDGASQEWILAGQIPIRYGHLLPKGAGDQGVAAIRRLVGEMYWKSIYKDRTIHDEDLIPMQMQWVLPRALVKAAKDLHASGDDAKKVVAEARVKCKGIMNSICVKRRKKTKDKCKDADTPPMTDDTDI